MKLKAVTAMTGFGEALEPGFENKLLKALETPIADSFLYL